MAPMMPMAKAPMVETKPAAGVMITRPTTAPVTAPMADQRLRTTRSTNIQVTKQEAAAW
eukprot:CAMPEP_0195017478 /NCGR_PEP_ID=MMETSP0326_2-20130528/27559_1 /TAXON_ID=2866 ORGANISM="Crypthecodinium cohnii, Strain Seligo" /NCGR_SAMPLE_ID=MMETSP0326_2 /ASSEMBLY_ACC=CAM_ASM_000348 /LENGTH=58 /DNA_ID=CAMNT_0040034117 /DNA_START=11 /DNA_END=187 /DNA_ORIENTATION=+